MTDSYDQLRIGPIPPVALRPEGGIHNEAAATRQRRKR
jgi:hypothetical protein